jgi:hypothetical protein
MSVYVHAYALYVFSVGLGWGKSAGTPATRGKGTSTGFSPPSPRGRRSGGGSGALSACSQSHIPHT